MGEDFQEVRRNKNKRPKVKGASSSSANSSSESDSDVSAVTTQSKNSKGHSAPINKDYIIQNLKEQIRTLTAQNKSLSSQLTKLQQTLDERLPPAKQTAATVSHAVASTSAMDTDLPGDSTKAVNPPILKAQPSTAPKLPGTAKTASKGSPRPPNGGPKPPPIFLRSKEHWPALNRHLQSSGLPQVVGKNTSDTIKIQVETPEVYRAVSSYLENEHIEFHSYSLKEDRLLQIVVRNLPQFVDLEDVKAELSVRNFSVEEIYRLKSRKDKAPMPLILVKLHNTEQNKTIFKIDNLCSLKVKVEPFKKSNLPAQCYRCQRYGHSSVVCHNEPRCLKCSGKHFTRDCKKPATIPAKCANCAKDHPANFKGCEVFKTLVKKSQQDKPSAPHTPAAPVFIPAPPPKPMSRSFGDALKGSPRAANSTQTANKTSEKTSQPQIPQTATAGLANAVQALSAQLSQIILVSFQQMLNTLTPANP